MHFHYVDILIFVLSFNLAQAVIQLFPVNSKDNSKDKIYIKFISNSTL